MEVAASLFKFLSREEEEEGGGENPWQPLLSLSDSAARQTEGGRAHPSLL